MNMDPTNHISRLFFSLNWSVPVRSSVLSLNLNATLVVSYHHDSVIRAFHRQEGRFVWEIAYSTPFLTLYQDQVDILYG